MDQPRDGGLCWSLDLWPTIDRDAWVLGCSPSDPFDNPHYANALSQPTLATTRKSYGRWLSFLASRGWLDPAQPAVERVTLQRLGAYFNTLRRAKNAAGTITGRFSGLSRALKIIAPGKDVAWICRPGGPTIYSLLPRHVPVRTVPDTGVLFDWTLEMMDQAREAGVQSTASLVAYRDGLFLAFLAGKGRRLRSMALLRIGHEFIERDGCFRIELKPSQVKTKKRDHFNFPEELTPYIRHYLNVVRPALLSGRAADPLWISAQGTACTAKALQSRVFKRTLARFGVSFGPHRFRHAIVTTAALRAPQHKHLGAAALGITPAVAEKNYNLASQVEATRTFAQAMERRHRKLMQSPQKGPTPSELRARMMRRGR